MVVITWKDIRPLNLKKYNTGKDRHQKCLSSIISASGRLICMYLGWDGEIRYTWEHCLFKHHTNFQCGNANLVIVINKGSSKDKFVMHHCLSPTWCNKYNSRSPFLWQHVSGLWSNSFPHATSCNYTLFCLQADISSRTWLDVPWFSNSIMHLLTHSFLLYTYMSQIYPHA